MHVLLFITSYFRFSDPYVRVEIDSTEVAQTTVKERNLNPIWNEACRQCMHKRIAIIDNNSLQSFKLPLYKLPVAGETTPRLKACRCWAEYSRSRHVQFDCRNFYKFGKMTGTIMNVGKQAFLGQVRQCVPRAMA